MMPNPERLGKPEQNSDSRRTFPALNPPHVIGVNIRFLGEGLLAQPRSLAISEDRFPNDVPFRFRHMGYENRN